MKITHLILSASLFACTAQCAQDSDQEESQWERYVRLQREGRIPLPRHHDGPDLRDVRDRPTPPGAFPSEFPYAGSAQQADDLIRAHEAQIQGQPAYRGSIGLAQQCQMLDRRSSHLDAQPHRIDTMEQQFAALRSQVAALSRDVVDHENRLCKHCSRISTCDTALTAHIARLGKVEKQQEELQEKVRVWRVADKAPEQKEDAAGK